MISFLTRPVTRLPRLMLQLDFVLKHIVGDNPDTTTIPLICESLNTYIRSSQAGVEAADGKVKFWDLCENLLYQKGEIIVRFSLMTPLIIYQFSKRNRTSISTTKAVRLSMQALWHDDIGEILAIHWQICT